jgi:hypothetical protein
MVKEHQKRQKITVFPATSGAITCLELTPVFLRLFSAFDPGLLVVGKKSTVAM